MASLRFVTGEPIVFKYIAKKVVLLMAVIILVILFITSIYVVLRILLFVVKLVNNTFNSVILAITVF